MSSNQLDKLKNTLITANQILGTVSGNNSLLKYFVEYDIIEIIDSSDEDVDRFVKEVFQVDRGSSSLNILLRESNSAIKQNDNHSLRVLNSLINDLANDDPVNLAEMVNNL